MSFFFVREKSKSQSSADQERLIGSKDTSSGKDSEHPHSRSTHRRKSSSFKPIYIAKREPGHIKRRKKHKKHNPERLHHQSQPEQSRKGTEKASPPELSQRSAETQTSENDKKGDVTKSESPKMAYNRNPYSAPPPGYRPGFYYHCPWHTYEPPPITIIQQDKGTQTYSPTRSRHERGTSTRSLTPRGRPSRSTQTEDEPMVYSYHSGQPRVVRYEAPITRQIFVYPHSVPHYEFPVVDYSLANDERANPHWYFASVPEVANVQDMEIMLAHGEGLVVMVRLQRNEELVPIGKFDSVARLFRDSMQLEVVKKESEKVNGKTREIEKEKEKDSVNGEEVIIESIENSTQPEEPKGEDHSWPEN
ncbi:hypothetical protein GGR57DRAFT_516171 [Xylariaceae sp. FL1272]|nr:hypothetical protein GGR57DRAFT_516171 [Xylariaceae sp. FL1272]